MLRITGSRLDKTDRISIDHVTIDYAPIRLAALMSDIHTIPPQYCGGFK